MPHEDYIFKNRQYFTIMNLDRYMIDNNVMII